MDWAQLIIVLIAIVVGVGSTIASQIKEQKKQRELAPRRTPPPRPPVEPVAPPQAINLAEDDAKYREEMNRQRAPKSAGSPQADKAAQRRQRARRYERGDGRRQQTVPPPLPTPVPPVPPAAQLVGAPIALVTPTPDKPPAAAKATVRPASPAVRNLLQLLKKRENLPTAVLLHEILGPPLCKRRHR